MGDAAVYPAGFKAAFCRACKERGHTGRTGGKNRGGWKYDDVPSAERIFLSDARSSSFYTGRYLVHERNRRTASWNAGTVYRDGDTAGHLCVCGSGYYGGHGSGRTCCGRRVLPAFRYRDKRRDDAWKQGANLCDSDLGRSGF